jgi:hypothetical protein
MRIKAVARFFALKNCCQMAAVGNLANYAFEKGVAEAEKVSYKQTV